jgi:hypothetical protein
MCLARQLESLCFDQVTTSLFPSAVRACQDWLAVLAIQRLEAEAMCSSVGDLCRVSQLYLVRRQRKGNVSMRFDPHI